MSLLEAILLGLIQGLTEFLPISSSAHVQIAQELMGLSELTKPQITAFIATIQIGTELAVVIFFAKTIWEILSSWFGNALRPWKNQPAASKLGWLVIVGSIPVVAIGLAFQEQIETDVRQLWVIGVALIVFGVILGIADHFGKKEREIKDLDFKSGLVFGLGQAMALIP
ncbi:MAG: undecaprenyl-diphosphatase UppP, partial [Actinomycetota bacterium]